MTNEPDNKGGAPDLSAILEEQKAVLTAMNDKIKALESRNSALEAKITALSAPAPNPQKREEPAADVKSEQEKAYQKVLAELGLKKAGDL